MRSSTFVACGAAIVLALADLPAQDTREAFRTSEDKAGFWLTYVGEHALSERWSFLVDGSIRRGEFASVWRSFLVRPALQWQLNSNVKFGAGYAYSYVYPSGSSSRLHTPEHRIFQQVILSHGINGLSLSHRYRFENRWFAQKDTLTGDDSRVESWLKRQRARYQVKATYPLGSGKAYLSSFDEIFINIGANVRYNVFDQNRFAAGLGLRLTNTLRLESYYLNYLVLHADGRGVDRNHVWLTILNSTQPFAQRSKQ